MHACINVGSRKSCCLKTTHSRNAPVLDKKNMSLFHKTSNYLESYFRSLSSRPLGVTKQEISKAIKEFYAYGAFAAPLMPRLAISGCFHYNRILSLLFLPFLVRHREIYLTEGNAKDLTTYLAEAELFDSETLGNVRHVHCSRWGSIYENVDLTCVETFFSLLPGLRVLTLKSHTSDAILEYLVLYCPNLQVLDCREDSFCEVTDDGLKKLSRLKKLRYVLFDTQEDEFEDESDQMPFTASGIRFLMMSLPELIELQCPEYPMREALHSLQHSGVVLPTVKSICLEGFEAHVDTFLAANEVCPNVTNLSIMMHKDEEEATADALSVFSSLSILTLNSLYPKDAPTRFRWCGPSISISILNLNKFGHKLTLLDIKKQVFTKEDIAILNEACPSLKLLSIFDQEQYNESFTRMDCIGDNRPLLFPSLETLVYKLRDFQGLFLFMHRDSLLDSLFAKVGYPIRMSRIVDILEQLNNGFGYWPNLSLLSIPDLCCDLALVTQIIEGLPSLERINVRVAETQEKERYLYVQGRSIRLSGFFDDEPFPPKHLSNTFDL